MRIFIGFDDTDDVGADRGTGKLARWFEKKLPQGAKLWGVVRQQLPKIEGIPCTSNNSAACLIIDSNDDIPVKTFIDAASNHIQEFFIHGSDPGLCVATERSLGLDTLIQFGYQCCYKIMRQKDAINAAYGCHLSGHGGTNDGIIGASAAIGLTLSGWSGRFIEFSGLRNFPQQVTTRQLYQKGIMVLPIDRNAIPPGPDDIIDTRCWLRPRLWGFQPVLPVQQINDRSWISISCKKNEQQPKSIQCPI